MKTKTSGDKGHYPRETHDPVPPGCAESTVPGLGEDDSMRSAGHAQSSKRTPKSQSPRRMIVKSCETSISIEGAFALRSRSRSMSSSRALASDAGRRTSVGTPPSIQARRSAFPPPSSRFSRSLLDSSTVDPKKVERRGSVSPIAEEGSSPNSLNPPRMSHAVSSARGEGLWWTLRDRCAAGLGRVVGQPHDHRE